MVERREWILGGTVIGLVAVLALLLRPTGSVYPVNPTLSSNLASPDGAKALYLTLERLGIRVRRWEAPLTDVGPLPHALAILAPRERLTPKEVSTVLDEVRAGGTLLWVATPLGALGDSLDLHPAWLGSFGNEPLPKVRVEPHPWTEGIDSVKGFRMAFRDTGRFGNDATPLLVTVDSLQDARRRQVGNRLDVLAFVAPLGRGRVIAFSDRAPLENRSIAESGIAPLFVRAAASAAGDGTLTFDEFHQGFHGGNVGRAVARFLVRYRFGHVMMQEIAVGLIALLLLAARLGGPDVDDRKERRSPLEHVQALGQVYAEASASAVPRLRLLGGLARALGEPTPRDERDAMALLHRVEGRGGAVAAPARALREAFERDERDLLATSRYIDRIREESNR